MDSKSIDEVIELLQKCRKIIGGSRIVNVWTGPQIFEVTDVAVGLGGHVMICIADHPVWDVKNDSLKEKPKLVIKGKVVEIPR